MQKKKEHNCSTSAFFTYVSLGENGRPVNVPQLKVCWFYKFHVKRYFKNSYVLNVYFKRKYQILFLISYHQMRREKGF